MATLNKELIIIIIIIIIIISCILDNFPFRLYINDLCNDCIYDIDIFPVTTDYSKCDKAFDLLIF